MFDSSQNATKTVLIQYFLCVMQAVQRDETTFLSAHFTKNGHNYSMFQIKIASKNEMSNEEEDAKYPGLLKCVKILIHLNKQIIQIIIFFKTSRS